MANYKFNIFWGKKQKKKKKKVSLLHTNESNFEKCLKMKSKITVLILTEE